MFPTTPSPREALGFAKQPAWVQFPGTSREASPRRPLTVVPHARRILGDAGEHIAGNALALRGWRVLERNARTRYGEIDLVCHDGAGYVFVEVKTRRVGSFVGAPEAVGRRKVDRLVRLAEGWLALHGQRGVSWRLAVAALTVGPNGTELEVIDVVG